MTKLWSRVLLIMAFTALAAGCAGPGPRPDEGAPVMDRSAPGEVGPGQAGSEQFPAARAPSTMSNSPAVVALLTEADRQARGGDSGNAAATLERALRIEPRNPVLWHQLAAVRMQQGNYTLAESLARKSNVLAGPDKALQARNWYLIADARRARGDVTGAQAARQRADSLSAESR